MMTISEYAKRLNISPQAAYKRIVKKPYSDYVNKVGNRIVVDDEILNIKEVETNIKVEPQEPSDILELQKTIKELQEENKKLQEENKELYKKLLSLSDDIQKTNTELLEILNKSMQLTNNSQMLMGYDKKAATAEEQMEAEEKPYTKSKEDITPKSKKGIKNFLSIFR